MSAGTTDPMTPAEKRAYARRLITEADAEESVITLLYPIGTGPMAVDTVTMRRVPGKVGWDALALDAKGDTAGGVKLKLAAATGLTMHDLDVVDIVDLARLLEAATPFLD